MKTQNPIIDQIQHCLAVHRMPCRGLGKLGNIFVEVNVFQFSRVQNCKKMAFRRQ